MSQGSTGRVRADRARGRRYRRAHVPGATIGMIAPADVEEDGMRLTRAFAAIFVTIGLSVVWEFLRSAQWPFDWL